MKLSKAESDSKAIAKAEVRIRRELPRLVDHLVELAYGIKTKVVTRDGEVEVYEVPPNLKALVYLTDRLMGRPMERQELSGPDGGPVAIKAQLKRGLDMVYPVPVSVN